MADKEATIYIIDLGKSMGERHGGRKETDLDWAMTYVWEKITSTIALDRKTATLGVVGLRTDRTENELGEQESFSNISVLQEIGQLLLPGLKELRPKIRVSNTYDGDAISAIVVAIQMISAYCKRLKYRRKIVLVTDGRGSLDGDDIPQITEKMKSDSIELVIEVELILTILSMASKRRTKTETRQAILSVAGSMASANHDQAMNEETLKTLADASDGVFGTMQQAIEELGMPRLKATRPVHSYRGQLTLGNPDEFDSAMCIDVERYPRVMVRRPLSASNYVQRSNLSISHESIQSSATILPDVNGVGGILPQPQNPLASVHNARTYQVEDENAPGGKRDVNRDDLAKGYEYGRTAVHISESDLNVTKLETQAGLEIIGFIPWATYERCMHMSVSCAIIAQKTNTKAIMALSSLIHALFELESYAVARLVTKSDKGPVITLLAPSIEVDYECLLDVQLPYAEDVRSYKFPPLDRVITVSGKRITEHRNLPSPALTKAMSDYVDRMDLSSAGKDDEGNDCEYMQMTDTYSPVLHRIDQAVRWRAIHPTKPIPPPYEILTRYSKPPESLVAKSKHRLEKLMAAADVKKVPPKAKSRKRTRNEVKPLSGLDVGALLGSKHKRVNLSKENAIPEFRQTLDKAESLDMIKDAAKQLSAMIESQIKESFADQGYQSALEKLGVLREEMIEMEEPDVYNDFVRILKKKLLDEELDGDRREMWWLIKKEKLGLIPKSVSSPSTITDDEAKEFWSSK
ncbi:MAG: hypothetical protein Q9217_001714 [Psora testacea]